MFKFSCRIFKKFELAVALRRIREILKGFLLMPPTLNARLFLYNSGERLQLGSRAHTSWQAISAVVYASLTSLLCSENINTRGADSYNDSAHIHYSPNPQKQIVNLVFFFLILPLCISSEAGLREGQICSQKNLRTTLSRDEKYVRFWTSGCFEDLSQDVTGEVTRDSLANCQQRKRRGGKKREK